jgi:hypothetical protein
MDVYGGLAWSGDWKSRILHRLQKLGFERVSDFLASRPGVSYLEVANSLGIVVAVVQLVHLQLEEAKERSCVRDAAMDSLVRCLTRDLPEGWTHREGQPRDFPTASAFGDWMAYLAVHGHMPELRDTLAAVWESLNAQSPAVGWRPTSPRDPLIVRAFATAWPA